MGMTMVMTMVIAIVMAMVMFMITTVGVTRYVTRYVGVHGVSLEDFWVVFKGNINIQIYAYTYIDICIYI